jgi:DNA-binding NarL/FixJ family response regulator
MQPLAKPGPRETRILVVDDSALMRRTLTALLETRENWRVCDEASNGREALEKFDKDKFDVIVLDLQMPEMDGLEAAKRITGLSPDTPILMVTMHSTPELTTEAKRAGIRGVCGKADTKCVVEGVETILQHKFYFQH